MKKNFMHRNIFRNIKNLAAAFILMAFSTQAQQLAFPTAEGFGRYATGGRGGIVYTVTNLNDDGEGSLRKGILKDGPRTIVFAVSGTIELDRPLDINKGDLTIAGQTAPGQGITIKGYPVAVKDDNVIIRYMRFRMGDIKGTADDSFKGRGVKNVILDHCSISWATDENASFYQNKDFTMQWCIISEALNSSVHSKGDHGYGGIWGGENVTFHHNLIASNYSRNPRFSGSKTTENLEEEFVDFRNNVIYNWADNSIYGGENGRYNIVNNYFKPGPATEDKLRIVEPYDPYGKFYVHGNYIEGSKEVTENNWNGGVQGDKSHAARADEAFDINNNVETQEARKAFDLVTKNAGASLNRDAVDIRIINETRSGKATHGNGIIDSQEQVGGWPKLKGGTSPKDRDEDGMPDAWEKENGLDPSKSDASGHALDTGYTNLEVYLNNLVEEDSETVSLYEDQYDFVVARDGSGDFKTVQEAIDAVPDFRKQRTRIFIKSGTYKEKLVLPASKTNVTFVGENKETTVLTYDDFAQKLNAFGEEIGTTGSTSFFVFGDGFHATNLTFENSAGPVGQAVAVRVDGDKVIFDNCRFLGFQDTLYPHGRNSRQYYRNCYIEGTTDFIFGWSVAVFDNCEIYSKDGGHYITAASTEEGAEHGFVFLNSRLTGNAPAHSVYLGRPWRDHAQTVFLNTTMGEHIKPEGWHNWSKPHAEKTVFYAEYNNSGPGYTPSKRVKWAEILSPEAAKNYTIKKVLAGSDNWDPTDIEKL